jgi:tetratricopeptide (TPR) repeat protein
MSNEHSQYDALCELGNILSSTGDNMEASKFFTEAINLDTSRAYAWSLAGLAHKNEGDLEKAIAYFDIAKDKTDRYYNHVMLADCYYYSGEYEKSRVICEEVPIVNPNWFTAQSLIGDMYVIEGRLQKAFDQFDMISSSARKIPVWNELRFRDSETRSYAVNSRRLETTTRIEVIEKLKILAAELDRPYTTKYLAAVHVTYKLFAVGENTISAAISLCHRLGLT